MQNNHKWSVTSDSVSREVKFNEEKRSQSEVIKNLIKATK